MDSSDLRVSITDLIGPRLAQLKSIAPVIAVIGAVLTGIGFVMNLQAAFQSYLFAWLFWGGAAIGCLGLLMLHHVVGGGWGWVIRRFLEAGTKLLIPMLILLIPVLLTVVVPGWGALYAAPGGWAHPDAANDPILQQKVGWLNPIRFISFSVICFIIWAGWAGKLRSISAILDQRHDAKAANDANVWGAAGLVFMTVTITFTTVDWVMTLTPHWLSSIIGLLYCAGNVLSALALLLALVGYLGAGKPLVEAVGNKYFRDLGNLMLALVMLWAYMSFSQYLIIYSANIAEYAPWYVARRQGGWGILSLGLIVVHFALPFTVLLTGSRIKKNPKMLGYVALFIVFMRFLDLLWWVAPNFRASLWALNPADLGAPLLLGGIWLTLWASALSGMSNVPVVSPYDPRVEANLHEVVSHHG
ncbi:MAG: hypothetical protein ACO1SX_05025 [Actinomycetota bacterium]